MRLKLVVATPTNRFVLAKYASEISSSAVTWDDDRHAGIVEHHRRAPLSRGPKPKPAPVDTTGIKITKLPPGEAYGARDLQRKN